MVSGLVLSKSNRHPVPKYDVRPTYEMCKCNILGENDSSFLLMSVVLLKMVGETE